MSMNTTSAAKSAAQDLKRQARAEQIATVEAEQAQRATELRAAQGKAATVGQALAAAEASWDRAEATHTAHTVADAARIELLRAEHVSVEATIADLEARLSDCRGRLAEWAHDDTLKQRQQLVADVWPPMVKRLVPAVRELVAALEAQEHVRDQLYQAGALGLLPVEPLTLPDAVWDDPAPLLRTWLAAVERAGLADAADATPAAKAK